MISIGGVIGTGVFLGISQSLKVGGPLGLLLGYSIVGLIVLSVVNSVAEIVAWLCVIKSPPSGRACANLARRPTGLMSEVPSLRPYYCGLE